jgi:ABC-2 type transport system ATP-binding protein
MIIARGRVVADGTPTELAARSRNHNAVRVSLRKGHVAAGEVIGRLPSVAAVEQTEDGDDPALLVFPKDGASVVAEIGDLARAHHWDLVGSRVERGRHDDVFRDVTTQAAA